MFFPFSPLYKNKGIAVYTIANMYKIPAIDIRVISDNAVLGEEYDRNISIKGQEFVFNLLKKLNTKE